MDSSDLIGQVVYSKAGRDTGKYFVIMSVFDYQYVFLADGDLRKIENPKKKKVKHLTFTTFRADEIRKKLIKGERVSNADVRKFLQSTDTYKEV